MGIGHSSVDVAEVEAARATALTLSPTSNVPGHTFDRFVQIFLENTDFDMAAGDPNMAYLATKGITMTDYHGVTHPSQPNYIAAVGGNQFQVILDHDYRIKKEKTIVDLLEAKDVSWSIYQEDMPHSGFQQDWVNQENGANDYVRKHNPLISFDTITQDPNRLAKCKNLTMLYQDIENETLPQWMFITPNMTNNGHDSDITTAAAWARGFLDPLLEDERFNSNRTLIVLTFDEAEHYLAPNRVFTLLLGDAVKGREGTEITYRYDHYSGLKTVEQNWNLGDLGQKDTHAEAYF